jgi:hypothetical protein
MILILLLVLLVVLFGGGYWGTRPSHGYGPAAWSPVAVLVVVLLVLWATGVLG